MMRNAHEQIKMIRECTLLCVELAVYWGIVINHESHCPIFESCKSQLCYLTHRSQRLRLQPGILSFFSKRNTTSRNFFSSLSCLGRAVYKQFVLSSAD